MPSIAVLMIASLAAMGIGWFWTIALGFQRSIVLGFLCMFWPASMMFALTDGKQSRKPAALGLFGLALGMWTGLFGPFAL